MVDYNFDKTKQKSSKEYFSGANVHVYFGNAWVDELASIEFHLQEEVAPIYGFHSYTFDRISRGQRSVVGEFTLNFTENGYLQSILDQASVSMESFKEEVTVSKKQAQKEMVDFTKAKVIQDILETSNYDTYIKELKNSFWGSESSSPIVQNAQEKGENTFFYSPRNGKENILLEHGFNILIDYQPESTVGDFKRCLNKIHNGKSMYRTFRSIIGVHITGSREHISSDGQVLQQTYQFLARDLDGDITQKSLDHTMRHQKSSISKFDVLPQPSKKPINDGNYSSSNKKPTQIRS